MVQDGGADLGNAIYQFSEHMTGSMQLITSSSYGSPIYRCLQSFNEKLWMGTTSGYLCYLDGTTWVVVASGFPAISSMVIYNNSLYFSCTDGTLRKLNTDNTVITVATKYGSEYPLALAILNNKIYASTEGTGCLLEWNGIDAWILRAAQLNSQHSAYSLTAYNGKLYVGTGDSSLLFEWNGVDAWIQVGGLNKTWYLEALMVFNGKLYAGYTTDFSTGGHLYEWNGVDTLTLVAAGGGYSTFNEIEDFIIYNNELYAGTGKNGYLVKWNGSNAWIIVSTGLGGYLDGLCVHNGILYAMATNGTLYANGKAEFIRIRNLKHIADGQNTNSRGIKFKKADESWDGVNI